MAAYLSTELGGSANQTSAPVGYKPSGALVGGRTKVYRASFTLAAQATTDTLVCFTLKPGEAFIKGYLYTDTTFGSTTTIAIGTAASTGKYRAAATLTTTNAPVDFGVTAAAVGAVLTAEEKIIVTIAAADLPASGNFAVVFQVASAN